MLKLVEWGVMALVGISIRRPRIVVALYAILAALSLVAAILFLRVDTDSSKMLASGLDFQQRTQALNRNFPAIKNSIILIVRSKIPDASDAASLYLAEKLKENQSISKVFAPSNDPFFKTNGLLYQDLETLDESLDRLNKSASMLANLRQNQSLSNFWHVLLTAEDLATQSGTDPAFLDDFYGDITSVLKAGLEGKALPLSWARASGGAESKDGSSTLTQRLIYVEPRLDFSRLQPAKPALDAVHQAIATLDDDLKQITDIGVTGDPVLRFEELRSVRSGIEYSLALSLIVVSLLLFLAFGQLKRVVLILSALIIALLLSGGFAALFVSPLNLVSVAFVVLLVGLGLDFSIHVNAHLDDVEGQGVNPRLKIMALGIGGALFLSFLTTALAFLSFVPTNFVGIAQLGGLGAAGVAIAFLISISYVPAAIAIFPSLAKAKAKRSSLQRLLPKLAPDTWQKPGLVLLIAAFFTLTYFAKDVRFDADPIALRNPQSPSMLALAILAEKPETEPYRISLLRADEKTAMAAASAVTKLNSVYSATTLADFVPKNQDDKFSLIDLSYPTFETIVEGDGLENVALKDGMSPLEALSAKLYERHSRPKAQRLLQELNRVMATDDTHRKIIEHAIFRFFPQLMATMKAQLGVDRVTLDQLPEPIRARYIGLDGQWRVDVVPKGDARNFQTLETFVAEVEAFDGAASGAPVQIVKAGETVSGAIVLALGLGTAGILLVAFAVLGSFTTLIAIFVPLAAAGLMTAGASAVFDIPFNYANVIVLPLLIGLGVDSSIHIAMRRAQSDTTAAFFATSTPKAVLFSALTTIAAFATLSVSPHRGTASMGQMLALAIIITLVCSIILTPFLMDILKRSGGGKGSIVRNP